MSAPFDRPLLGEAVSGLGREYGVNPQAGDEERVVESALRPHSLHDFIGQPKVARQLALVLEGAKRRGRPPDHVLLAGPPGLGKTSLALIIGSELGTSVKITSGPAIEPESGRSKGLLMCSPIRSRGALRSSLVPRCDAHASVRS